MKPNNQSLQKKLLSGGAVSSGTFGAIGSLPNVCHSLCVGIVSLLSLFGITISILPLMFLQTYRIYFWLAAFAFTALSLYFFLKYGKSIARDRNLLFINAGLLVFGIPFSQFVDYMDFFRFVGISLVAIGIFLFFFSKRFKLVNRPAEEIRQIPTHNHAISLGGRGSVPQMPSKSRLPKLNLTSALFALVTLGFLLNQYLIYKMNGMGNMNFLSTMTNTSAMGPIQQKKLTAFDIALAKERMDKNNDGICDTCGMPIQQCIDTGQIDCNMGNNSQAIGVLGSAHDHADLNIYNNGQRLIIANPENYMKSAFIHLDSNQNPNDANSVLHMHAKKVPLWLYFRSLGMNLTKDSLTLADGQVLKNENGKTLKFYLDGKKIDELGDYSFQSLDRLLITYGPENDSNVQGQIKAMTNFARDH